MIYGPRVVYGPMFGIPPDSVYAGQEFTVMMSVTHRGVAASIIGGGCCHDWRPLSEANDPLGSVQEAADWLARELKRTT